MARCHLRPGFIIAYVAILLGLDSVSADSTALRKGIHEHTKPQVDISALAALPSHPVLLVDRTTKSQVSPNDPDSWFHMDFYHESFRLPSHLWVSISSLDLAPEAEDRLDGALLSTWWPHARSHWQEPVNPFVAKREVVLSTMVEEEPSGFDTLTKLLPIMKPASSIPMIFHQVYLDGEEALEIAEEAAERSQERWPPVKRAWRQACKRLHPQWEFKLWNLSSMEAFLQQRYPWFLPTFDSYPERIHKVDAVRPFLMHAFGGVYIDLDVECLHPIEPFLADHELVFQLEDFGEKSLVNSAIAGAPGLYFWEVWQQVIAERAVQLRQRQPVFSKRDWEVLAVLNTTGPWALRAAFQQFSRDFGLLKTSYVGAWTINNIRVMVYPLGTWMVPCLWNNARCHSTVEGKIAARDVPPYMAGHHKNAGSWFKAAGFNRAVPWWDQPPLFLRAIVFAALLLMFWRIWWRARRARIMNWDLLSRDSTGLNMKVA